METSNKDRQMKNESNTDLFAVIKPEQAEIQLNPNGQLAFRKVGDIAAYVILLHNAGLLPIVDSKTNRQMEPRVAVGNILSGMQIGLTPWQSILCMANVNGKPSVYGDALVGLVLASGLMTNQKTEYFSDASKRVRACRYTCWRKGFADPVTGEFSLEMAQAAGLMGHMGWKNYPRRMLKMRARAFALRDAFADVLGGVRIREEEEDAIPAEYTDLPAEPAKPVTAAQLIEAAASPEPITVAMEPPTPQAEPEAVQVELNMEAAAEQAREEA